MNSRLSKMNKNLASMHDEKEKANAMAKKVRNHHIHMKNV